MIGTHKVSGGSAAAAAFVSLDAHPPIQLAAAAALPEVGHRLQNLVWNGLARLARPGLVRRQVPVAAVVALGAAAHEVLRLHCEAEVLAKDLELCGRLFSRHPA